jgi:hypothetical protein
MSAEDMVDAALVGFDNREFATIPALANITEIAGNQALHRNQVQGRGNTGLLIDTDSCFSSF